MHIHGTPMNTYVASLQSTAQPEKAASAQRAAETRRRLALQGEGSIDEGFTVGQTPGEGSRKGRGARRGQEELEEHEAPISVWA